MMREWYELGIIAFILAGIAYTLWRGGQQNPVGTGRLQSEVGKVRNEVSAFEARLKQLDENAASKGDVERLSEIMTEERAKIDQVFTRIAGINEDLNGMRSENRVKTQVITGLSESMRLLASDLKAHREDVSARLARLEGMANDIRANRQAIETIHDRLKDGDALLDKLLEAQARSDSKIDAIGKNLDRIYDVLVPKGMG